MEKRAKRDNILYVRIQKKNMLWIESQMKKLGYPPKTGRAEFIDTMFTKLRNKK